MKISLIIPAYNEEKCIENTIIKCIDYMSQNFDDYEIITVNDGSNDKTEKILKKYKNFLKIITLFENCGKGYAVKCGVFARFILLLPGIIKRWFCNFKTRFSNKAFNA